jgi:hypothetical protein
MPWQLYRWVWQLEAPVQIGVSPAGILNRTRLYVPARTMWGALTAELARRKSASFPEYSSEGDRLRRQTRLSYLFPAQRVGRQWQAWLPRYEWGEGLLWRREDGVHQLPGAQFQRWLIITRPGTAIDPDSDTAAEGALREREAINLWSLWGEAGDPQPVALVGHLFLADDADQDVLDIEELFIGGDSHYGLGRIRKVECSDAREFFGKPVHLKGNHPVVTTDHLLAHALQGQDADLLGALEQLVVWEYNEFKTGLLTWVPGSRFGSASPLWHIRDDGLWERMVKDGPSLD